MIDVGNDGDVTEHVHVTVLVIRGTREAGNKPPCGKGRALYRVAGAGTVIFT
ncbi:hypothetical protein D3C83_215470 [compost metagenome]